MESLRSAVGSQLTDDNSAGAIVASLCLPDTYPVVRMKDGFTTVKSATANPFQEYSNNWPAPVNNVAWFTGFQFRDTLRHSIIYDANPTNSIYTYTWSLGDGTTAIPVATNQFREFAPAYATATTAYAPHDQYLWAVTDSAGHPLIWVDADPVTTADGTKNGLITVTPAGTLTTGTVTLYYWDGSQSQVVSTSSLNTSATTFNGASKAATTVNPGVTSSTATLYWYLKVPGYYRVEFDTIAASGASYTVTSSTGSNNIYTHHAVPGYADNVNNVNGIRIQGFSTQWRNTASDQYVNGRVACVQFGKGENWMSVIQNGVAGAFDQISAVRESETRDFKRGMFAFAKPAEDNDLRYIKPLVANSPTNWVGATPAQPESGFLAFAAQVVSSSSAPATNNLWADVRIGTADRDVWKSACQALSNIRQFHDNPTHLPEILTAITDIGVPLTQAANQILRLFPQDSDIVRKIRSILKLGETGLTTAKRINDVVSSFSSQKRARQGL